MFPKKGVSRTHKCYPTYLKENRSCSNKVTDTVSVQRTLPTLIMAARWFVAQIPDCTHHVIRQCGSDTELPQLVVINTAQ